MSRTDTAIRRGNGPPTQLVQYWVEGTYETDGLIVKDVKARITRR